MKVMVFIYEPALNHSVWRDFWHRYRSKERLVEFLNKEVKRGSYVGWRLIEINHEQMGVM